MKPIIDERENIYGKLTVLEYDGNRRWTCICECGTKKSIDGRELRKGQVKSCGCLRKELARKQMTTHGTSYEPFYYVWRSMRDRCNNQAHKSYARYGGRGIKCLWSSFEEFKKDMYEDYILHSKSNKTTTLERKDNNRNYCKENCRWATAKEQARNRSNNRYLTIDGQTKVLSEWAEIAGIGCDLLCWRIKNWGEVPEVIRKGKNKHHVNSYRS